MATPEASVSVAELRLALSDSINRVAYGQERLAVTRRGKVAAVLISVEDLERLEALEDAQDLASYQAAKAVDDGTRVDLADLLDEVTATA